MSRRNESMTALVSMFGRAYHSLYDKPKIFDDYLARKLITDEEFSNISKHMAQGINFFNPKEAHLYPDESEALRWVVQNQIAPTPLARSRYAEDMLENAIRIGARQYVILGAGFDTFVFRKSDLLGNLGVFEVDHPVTQKSKKRRVTEAGWGVPNTIKYVPVDFSTDDFVTILLEAGFKSCEQSFFSWLGVSYYLTRAEVKNMLRSIARIAPAGSAIVFDYPDDNIFDSQHTTKRVEAMVSMAKMAGEPMKTAYSYDQLESDLEEAGWLIYEHLTPADIENRYFRGRDDDYHAFENINFALAVLAEK